MAAFVFVIAGWLSLSTLEPPSGVTVAADGFSLERALADVAVIAAEPRPTGSPAHARAREYLLRELRAAGLEATVQESVVRAGAPPAVHRLTRVRNVIGHLRGRGEGDAILLAAHYDSVPAAPGAGDDAAGVAALLETMRVMAANGPPGRDVVFLFTDAEEIGLHGARAFVDAGLADDVGWVLNFEARGAGGASLMFETLPGDAEAMRFFAEASPKPAASSYSYDIYRRMPNDTDFSVFREVIPAGFNFAFIEDPSAYHASVDTPRRLDEASLRHHGIQALSLARHLAASPPDRGGPRAVYFSLPFLGLVVYPAHWDKAVALGCAALGLVVLVAGLRRRQLTPGRFLLCLPAVALVPAVSAGGLLGLRWLWVDALGLAGATKGVLAPLGYGWLLLAGGMASVAATSLVRVLGTLNLAAGAAIAWTALALAGAWLLGSSTFLFTWPVLFGWLALLVAVTDTTGRSPWRAPAVLACAVPALLIWVPTLKSVAVALGPAAGILGVLAALPVLLVTLPLALLGGPGGGRWAVPGAALAVGLALFGWAATTAGPSPAHPAGDSLVYALDADAGTAQWASYDDAPDDWTGRVLGEAPARGPLPAFFDEELELLTAPAEVMALPAPRVAVLESRAREGGGRELVLQLRSARGAPWMAVTVEPAGELLDASVDGKALEVNGAFELAYHALPETGLRLELVLGDAEPVTLSVVDGSFGLPASLLPASRPPRYEPRRFPWAQRAARFPFSDTTLVRTRRSFPASPGT